MSEKSVPVTPLLARALQHIRFTPPRIIASPPTQPRRAAVALIIRVVPSPDASLPPTTAAPPSLTEFFEQSWVNDPDARPEILFLRRDYPPAADEVSVAQSKQQNTQEAHVAFPGGRMEPDDEGGLYTAMRQTWEEIGIDLAEHHYTCIGQLDDREITTSLGKRLLMILSPFVFLQLTPHAPPPDPIPSTTLHWTSLASLISPHTSTRWSTVTVDAASRMAPKHSTALRLIVRILVGTMEYPALLLDPTPSIHEPTLQSSEKRDGTPCGAARPPPPKNLKLWGLSLGMMLDLMSYMIYSSPTGPAKDAGESLSESPLTPVMQLPYQTDVESLRMEIVAPSLASVFPRFSYPDVNFWIWVFGKRYREVVRGWEQSVRSGGTNDRRINWSGSALSTFYAAIRKALILVIIARALGIIFGVAFAVWWVFFR